MKSYYTGIMSTSHFDEIEHTADVSLHIQSEDLAGLFRSAASAMLSLMGMSTDKEGEKTRTIEVEGIDQEDLLVAWLQELLYLMERHGVGFGKMDIVAVSETHLAAITEEIPGMVPSKEIKAVTYHDLEIKETERGLEVTVVFDV
jgi:SHS2 domain-containing protein